MGYGNLSNIVGTWGEVLGLPEGGRSEALAQGNLWGAVTGTQISPTNPQTQPAILTPQGSYTGLGNAGPAVVVTPNQSTTNNTQKTVQTNTGADPHINPATGQWDDNYYASQQKSGSGSGPSQEDIQKQIDAIYNPSFDYLNQAESNLNSQYPDVLKSIQSNYDVNNQTLGDQNTSANQILNSNVTSATNRKEDALSAARRLYSELRQGYQQRFGGSTSAGQAASELSSVEQQRQMGQTNRSYADTLNSIDTQRSDLNRAYNTSVMKLKTDTDTARSQAYQDFQNKLLQITQSRAGLYSAKATASLDALNSFKNQIFAIQQQNVQFQQTLEAQRQAAELSLNTYQKQLALAAQGSTSALSNLYGNTTTNPTTGLNIGNTAAQTGTNYVGSISGKTLVGYDLSGNPIYK